MIGAACLLCLALLGQAQPRTYYWRDAAGQTHITNTPPPGDAEILDAPPPTAVEPGRPVNLDLIRPSAVRGGQSPVELTPTQKQDWEALDRHLAQARSRGDLRTLGVVTDALIQDCLWGNGLWAMPALPVISVLLLGLLGWWVALGLRPTFHVPLVVGFLVLGLLFGHLLLNGFLYHPQAVRLQQNLERLEHHMGTGKALRPEQRALLQQRYLALEQATEPFSAPWRFPAKVKVLRETMKKVMVEP
ncbi:MAG TPA: DUF4124 domain-containing protein [Geothrix sp.]